jgi:hypothetical protein
MANVLGSLVIDVLANTGTFISGMDKASAAARRSGREVRESFAGVGEFAERALAPLGELGEKIASTLGDIGKAAGNAVTSFHGLGAGISTFAAVGAGAAVGAVGLGGALFAAATHAAELGSKIFEASEKTGLSAENLSGLMAVAKMTGGNFDGLTTALARATVNLTKTAEHAGKTNAELFALMGGAKGAAELGLKPMDDRIQTVLANIFKLRDEGQRNVALTELLGKGWQDNVTILRQLAEQGYGPAIEKAKQMGIFFDADHARQAKDFQTAMNNLTTTLDGLAVTVGQKVIPFFTAMMVTIMNMGHEMSALAKDAKVVFDVLSGNIGAVGADLAEEKLGWDDYWKAIAATNADLAKYTAGAKDATVTTDNLAGSTTHHADALERAVKASHDFWAEYNAGLTKATTTLPRFVSLADQALAALHPGQVQMPSGEWRDLPKTETATSLNATISDYQQRKGANLDPFGAMGDSASRAIAPISDLGRQMQLILQAPATFAPPAKKSLDELQGQFTKVANGIADQLAALAVTGRAHWRDLFRGFEEEMIRSGIQKLFSNLMNMAFNPTSASQQPSGAPTGALGFLGKMFGGMLAGGGDVTPGKAYVVGEKHPEFFVPRTPGEVRTAMPAASPRQTIVNFHVHGVQNPDSFRASQSQTMAMLLNQMGVANARNR